MMVKEEITFMWIPTGMRYWGKSLMFPDYNSGCVGNKLSQYDYNDIHIEGKALASSLIIVDEESGLGHYKTYSDLPFDYTKPHLVKAKSTLWNHSDCNWLLGMYQDDVEKANRWEGLQIAIEEVIDFERVSYGDMIRFLLR